MKVYGEEWWHGGLKWEKRWCERHSHTKAKRRSFPSNHFFPSFPSFLFSSALSFPDSLLPSHHPLSITYPTPISYATHVHTHNEQNPNYHNTKSISSCFSHVQFYFCYIFLRQVISQRKPLCHDYALFTKLYSLIKSII